MMEALLILMLIIPSQILAKSSTGKELYQRTCTGCHSVNENRIGPQHRGVLGRQAGSLKDFEYSDALKKSKVVWNEENLNKWLENPNKFIPGNKMGFRITNKESRKHIVNYLKSLK